MRALQRYRFQGARDQRFHLRIRNLARSTGPRFIRQPLQARSAKSLPPLAYSLIGDRWFVGLEMDDAVWDVTVFTKNWERLLKSQIADGFFEQVLKQARDQQLLSVEHFTVDGTLIEAWAGQKSFQR